MSGLRSLVLKAMSELVCMGQPEGAKVKWRNELIDRERVMGVVTRLKHDMDALQATPPAAATVDFMLPRRLADGYRRRKNLGPEHIGRLVEMFQQMLIEAKEAALTESTPSTGAVAGGL